jgi:hypothetical protein
MRADLATRPTVLKQGKGVLSRLVHHSQTQASLTGGEEWKQSVGGRENIRCYGVRALRLKSEES